MTVNELIVDHRYTESIAFDRSPHRNHGRLVGVHHQSNGLRFDLGADRVHINPSPTLQRMLAVAVEVDITLDPGAGTRRHNLVESHASFALYVNPDRSVSATVYDGRGNWPGATTAAGVIVPGSPHRVRMLHDGAACLTVWVDGVEVAKSYDALGPVSGVKHFGCAIGHWPDPDDRYTFHGWIRSVRIWRFNPDRGAQRFIDRCCLETESVDAQLGELLASTTPDQMRATIDELVDIGARNFGRLAQGGPARRDQARAWARGVAAAIGQGDRDALFAIIEKAAASLNASAPPAEIADDAAAIERLVSSTSLGRLVYSDDPVDSERLAALFDAWCWGWVRAPKRPPRGHEPNPERPTNVPDRSDPAQPTLGHWAHDEGNGDG